jgi:hypothetical protein
MKALCALFAVAIVSGCAGARDRTRPQAHPRAVSRAAGAMISLRTLRGHRDILRRGGVVRLVAARYGSVDLSNLHPRRALTLLGARGRPQLTNVDLTGAAHVLLRHVELPAGATIGDGATNVTLEDVDLHGQALVIRAATHVALRHAYVHDVVLRGSGAADGFGVWAEGASPRRPAGLARDLQIQSTCFANLAQDGVHVGDVQSVRLTGDEFVGTFASVNPTVHADAIQVHRRASEIGVLGNWFHDTNRGMIVKDDVYPGLVVSGNFFERIRGWALDLYDTPGAQITGNIVRDQPGASIVLHEQHSQMRGVTLTGNSVESLVFARSQVAQESGNLVAAPKRGIEYSPSDVRGTSVPGTPAPASMHTCQPWGA